MAITSFTRPSERRSPPSNFCQRGFIAMFLSYLPDEMKIDFARSLALGAEWGIRSVDVRSIDGVNVIDLTPAQLARAQAQIAQHGMQVAAVATPFYKCTLPGHEEAILGDMHSARPLTYADHVRLLRRGVEVAQAFGAPLLRIFSFWRQEGVDFWPALGEAVQTALAATEESGVAVGLENEGACFIGTSAELAEVARRFPDPRLRFIWDPGNSTHSGMPPRAEDFAYFAPRIDQVHLKDATYDVTTGRSSAALIGTGATDYPAELRRLAAAGYAGVLTLEPHYCPGGDCVDGMRRSVAAIRRVAREVGVELG
jgi:sugar phosphate isomerase/epimerase